MKHSCNIINCDVYQAINKIKSRYASAFIFSLEHDSRKFHELEQEFSYISSTQVSRTLKQLINDDLVINNQGQYALTIQGRQIIPILNSLEEWNENFTEKTVHYGVTHKIYRK